MVRMEWTVEEFFNTEGGGTTKFIDRLASSINVPASDVTVTSVYEGSLVINYDIIIREKEKI